MKAGLLGRRLGHSLSPQIHGFFGDYEYRLYEREPEDVAEFVRGSGLDLLNVTIPYKKAAAELCDELTPLAQRLGNVNLVTRSPDGRLRGDNTDYFGFARLLDSVCEAAGVGMPANAAVLGSGGAATTAKTVLADRGVDVAFVRRGEMPSPDAGLIVNATPVGMFPDVDGRRVDIAEFPGCRMVLDLVYNPSPTRLVREALSCGKAAADGMVMLIAQAYRAFRLAGGEIGGNVYLYGPPASGKSTWAKMVAAATGLGLVDLDAEIVREAGRPIADIFASDGEAAFRRLEKGALARVAGRGGQVVALGGGALIDGESRALAEATGRVVLMDCGEEELLRRAALSRERPLLAGDAAARLRALLASRRDHYASFGRRLSF